MLPDRMCPHCLHRGNLSGDRCPVCGYPVAQPQRPRVSDSLLLASTPPGGLQASPQDPAEKPSAE